LTSRDLIISAGVLSVAPVENDGLEIVTWLILMATFAGSSLFLIGCILLAHYDAIFLFRDLRDPEGGLTISVIALPILMGYITFHNFVMFAEMVCYALIYTLMVYKWLCHIR